MKLLPSLKLNQRYIAFDIISDKKFTVQEIETAVMSAIKDFIGVLGLSRAAPLLVRERYTPARFILKVNHNFVNEIKSALSLLKDINGIELIIKSVITSGTLKKVSI